MNYGNRPFFHMNNRIILQKLSKLIRQHNNPCYIYYIAIFKIEIYTHRIQEHPPLDKLDSILNHEVVDVYVFELNKTNTFTLIDLEEDIRFANYFPIKYRKWSGYSTGVEMPITHLCELIKYLYKLSGLSI